MAKAKIKVVANSTERDKDTVDAFTGKTDSETGFTIESGIDAPDPARRRRKSKYPFDQLAVGQSFFVPASGKLTDPARQLASTVSSANRRYKNDDGTYNRRFMVAEAASGESTGARIWRVAPKDA